MTPSCTGHIIVAMTTSNSASRPRNRSLANAKPAIEQNSSVLAVIQPPQRVGQEVSARQERRRGLADRLVGLRRDRERPVHGKRRQQDDDDQQRVAGQNAARLPRGAPPASA